MTDDPDHQPPDLKTLAERLRRARSEPDADAPRAGAGGQAMGLAFRMATELVAALAVGGVLGWWADRWLGTRPWGLVVLLVLGAAAGVMGAFREAGRWNPGGDNGGTK